MENSLVDQIRNVRIVKRINNRAATSLTHNKPKVSQQPKLMRDRRPFHLDRGGEIVDAAGAFTQPGQNAHPTRGCKRLHRVRHLPRGCQVDDRRTTVPFNSMTHHQEDT